MSEITVNWRNIESDNFRVINYADRLTITHKNQVQEMDVSKDELCELLLLLKKVKSNSIK